MIKPLVLLNIFLDILGFVPGPTGIVSSLGRLGTNFVEDDGEFGMTIPAFIPRATSTTKDFTKLYHTLRNVYQASAGATKSIGKLMGSSAKHVSAATKLGNQVGHASNAIRGAANAGGRLFSKVMFGVSFAANSYQLYEDVKRLYKDVTGKELELEFGCKKDVDCVCDDIFLEYTDADIEQFNDFFAKEGENGEVCEDDICTDDDICYDYIHTHFEHLSDTLSTMQTDKMKQHLKETEEQKSWIDYWNKAKEYVSTTYNNINEYVNNKINEINNQEKIENEEKCHATEL